jgi:hypothetical protein
MPTITATTLSNSSVKLSWVDDACSLDHRVQYRKVGTTTYTTKIVYDSLGIANATLTGLLPNTSYEYHVRTDCNTTGTFNSGYTTLATITTPLRIGDVSNTQLSISPNPSTGLFTIDYPGDYNLKVYNMLGELVFEKQIAEQDGVATCDLSNLNNGIYLVSIISANEVLSSRIEIQK